MKKLFASLFVLSAIFSINLFFTNDALAAWGSPRKTDDLRVVSPQPKTVWQLGNSHTISWYPEPQNPNMEAFFETKKGDMYEVYGKLVPCGKGSIIWCGGVDKSPNNGTTEEVDTDLGSYYVSIVDKVTKKTARTKDPIKLVQIGDVIKLIASAKDKNGKTINDNTQYSYIELSERKISLNWKSKGDSCRVQVAPRVEVGTDGNNQEYQNIFKEYSVGKKGKQTFNLGGNLKGYYVTIICDKDSNSQNKQFEVTIDGSVQSASKIDLKVNGSNNPSEIQYGSTFQLTWAGQGLTNGTCVFSGHYVPVVGGGLTTDLRNEKTSGSLQLEARHSNYGFVTPLEITVQCSDDKGNNPKSTIKIPVKQTKESTIKVLSPNGGESFVADSSIIKIKGQLSNVQDGSKVIAYLYHPELGDVRSIIGEVTTAGTVYMEMNLGKGGGPLPGQYKISMCAEGYDNPEGKGLCDSSDNYFTLISSKINPTLELVSMTAQGANENTNGVYNFKFKVTANGEDMYIPNSVVRFDGAGGVSYEIFDASTGSHDVRMDQRTSLTSDAKLVPGQNLQGYSFSEYYLIKKGETKNFTASIRLSSPDKMSTYSVEIYALTYTTEPKQDSKTGAEIWFNNIAKNTVSNALYIIPTITPPLPPPSLSITVPKKMTVGSESEISVTVSGALIVPTGSKIHIVLDDQYVLASKDYSSDLNIKFNFIVPANVSGLAAIAPEQLKEGEYNIKAIINAPDTVPTLGGKGIIVSSSESQKVNISIPAVVNKPSIKLLSPNGSATYNAGDTVNIQWASTGVLPVEKININLVGEDVLFEQPIKKLENTGSYSFVIPTTAPKGSYRINIYTSGAEFKGDRSDQTFRINSSVEPLRSLNLLSPNGGGAYNAGDTINVKWASNVFNTDTIRILLYEENSKFKLSEFTKNTGNYSFKIPSTVVPGKYKIQIANMGGLIYSDQSDATFEIKNATNTISVLSTQENLSSNTSIFSTLDLELGMAHSDVITLQKFLNANGYTIETIAGQPGSSGNESNYFGEKTKQALIKYQKDKGIYPAWGFFGPQTRRVMGI